MAQRRVLYSGAIMKIDPATFAHLEGGYARDANTVWFAGEEVRELDPATTFAFAGDYASDGKRVVFRQHEMEAHAPSFEVLGMVGMFAIARDRDRLYTLDGVIEGPDAKTFELLGAGIAADREGLWQVSDVRDCSRIEGDRATLRILDDDYACDSARAWYRGTFLDGADASRFQTLGHGHATDGIRFYRGGDLMNPTPSAVLEGGYAIVGDRVRHGSELEGADAATFRALGHLFARDDRRVYFDGGVVSSADAETFVVLATMDGCGWARDSNCVWYRQYQWHDYWDGETLNEVTGADPASFEALDETFGRDASHVWRGLVPLDDADPASFRVLGNGWSRDAKSLWSGDRRMTGTNPDTLAIHGNYAVLEIDEPDLEVIGDGYARSGDAVLFAGYTIEASGDARSLGGGYLVDATGACHYELATASLKMPEFSAAGGRLDGADPATLRRDRGFAIDRESVFAGCHRIFDVVAPEFRALDAHHGTDGRVAYFDAIRIECDVEQLRSLGGKYAPRGYTLSTIDVIDDAWATDGTTLFLQGRPVWDRNARYLSEDSEALLRRLDVARFSLLDPWWATDGHVVVQLRDGHIVEAAHAPSFEALGHGYGRDISHVWSRAGRLADANPGSFRVLADGYASDPRNAWFDGYPIPDARELRVLGGGWARDAVGILCGTARVAADPETFVVVGSVTAAEGDWDASRLEVGDPNWLGERVAVGRDRDHLWWGSYSGSTPAGAVAIGHGYVVDDAQVWHAGTEIDADGTTFVAIGGGYARDAFRVYFHDRVTR